MSPSMMGTGGSAAIRSLSQTPVAADPDPACRMSPPSTEAREGGGGDAGEDGLSVWSESSRSDTCCHAETFSEMPTDLEGGLRR